MTMNEWEDRLGLKIPFEISNVKADVGMIDGKPIDQTAILENEDNDVVIHDIHIRKRLTKEGTWKGFTISLDNPHAIKMRFLVTLTINRNDIKPAFIFEKEVTNG